MLSRRTFVISLGAVAGLTACSSNPSTSNGSSANSEQTDAFPITITHAFGETVIEAKPERIATVGWASQEVPLAFGVVPVGMPKVTWGDDDTDGILPWVKQKLDELGAETPVLFDETDSIPVETIANTAPDLILATYSGIEQDVYDQLSKIAPTIAYPTTPWNTPLNELVTINSRAMGMSAKGKELNAELEATIAAAFTAQPSLAGKKVMWGFFEVDDLSKIGIYTTHDPRASFLESVGMVSPQVVVDESAKTTEFFVNISSEKPELLADVDLIVSYGPEDPAPLLAAMQADPRLALIPAVAEGRITFLGGNPLANAANPSPLSVPWGIDQYFAKLAEGLA